MYCDRQGLVCWAPAVLGLPQTSGYAELPTADPTAQSNADRCHATSIVESLALSQRRMPPMLHALSVEGHTCGRSSS
jgi:hypothetical protein